MKYKTLIIGAITLGALSLANANANRVDNSGDITLGHSSSAKENPNGPLNTRYGAVEFKNLTPDTDYIIEADDKKSKDGTFLIRNPITVKPGETAKLQFAMNWGENAAMDAEADVHCESSGGASATLFIGGVASGHYNVEASCRAVARLTQKAYLGIAATSHPVAKVSAVTHHKTKSDCVVKFKDSYISVNPITYAAANVHQSLDNMAYDDGYLVWSGKTYKGYVTNNHFEPTASEIDQPTAYVYSPTWAKTTIERCAGDPQ